ncbi:MAG: efflux RND transporter periplasmic adaptor subunit [Methyloligellaceae bacterium]
MAENKEKDRSHSGKQAAAAGQAVPEPSGRGWRFVRLAMKTLTPLVVLALGAASYAGLKATKPQVPERPTREKVWAVKTAPVDFSNYQPDLRLYGETIVGRRVELRALVAGKVIETGKALREGGLVKKDDVLLRIDPFEYEGALDEARARLKEARARATELDAAFANEQDALRRSKEQLTIARRDLERAIPLAKRGTVSKKVADDRRMVVSEREQASEQRANNLSIQQARSEQQRAIIAQLDWKVRQAQRNLRDAVLTAPFDAYVTAVSAEVGRLVGANDQVATLLDRNWVEVRFVLTDRQFGRILAREGTVVRRPVKVRWNVGDAPIVYDARIERVAAEISSESGGVQVYARLADPASPLPIRAGAFVEIRVPDRPYENVARLPQTALYGGDRVYVVEEGRLSGRTVEVIGTAGEDILVRGKIAAGDRVVTTRLSSAGEGLRVREHGTRRAGARVQ